MALPTVDMPRSPEHYRALTPRRRLQVENLHPPCILPFHPSKHHFEPAQARREPAPCVLQPLGQVRFDAEAPAQGRFQVDTQDLRQEDHGGARTPPVSVAVACAAPVSGVLDIAIDPVALHAGRVREPLPVEHVPPHQLGEFNSSVVVAGRTVRQQLEAGRKRRDDVRELRRGSAVPGPALPQVLRDLVAARAVADDAGEERPAIAVLRHTFLVAATAAPANIVAVHTGFLAPQEFDPAFHSLANAHPPPELVSCIRVFDDLIGEPDRQLQHVVHQRRGFEVVPRHAWA